MTPPSDAELALSILRRLIASDSGSVGTNGIMLYVDVGWTDATLEECDLLKRLCNEAQGSA